ncbi:MULTISPECIES: DUF262 domain-containing protein [Agrobacterium tumefaciens complex]|uniref:GmrSD restriction endonucleases N-terminal domain-containing protein n=1 Tax=Agrobacterium tomkonis CFBP 6623 TaxID=1183432 RepID=A0A1S7NMP5_9HYPH|nr:MULTISPECIES: DUF262 domain-containing protein [Agrobacterium tumefaciens complex]QCL89639.1 DUF262 domain-containing protein [Agrobacterium tumefaciens]CUX09167.1 conserved hypothetical protein [Agrobacterium tomkonis CFBP 6623]
MIEDEDYRDQPFEYDEQAEGSDDYKVRPEDFKNLFIIPSDWTVSTIRDQIATELDLDPEFQRRAVWNKVAKSRFIESLILGIPIPQILLSSDSRSKASYIVLDGKQRLIAIKQFFDQQFDDGTTFKLSGLENLDELNGKTWDDIQRISKFKRAIENATIRTAVLKGWEKEAVLYEIFYRLNSGSVKLSPMELRTALHRGPFLRFVIRWTEQLSELHALLRLKAPDKRMSDVELTVRYLAYKDSKIEYRGNLKDYLDKYCRQKNDDFDVSALEKQLSTFESSIGAARKVFGPKAVCRKWLADKNEFDTRFNRAIFDVIIGSFAHDEFRAWALKHAPAVRNGFIELCQTDHRFVTSVETTTKSTGATRYRFEKWYEVASKLSGVKLTLPKIASDAE